MLDLPLPTPGVEGDERVPRSLRDPYIHKVPSRMSSPVPGFWVMSLTNRETKACRDEHGCFSLARLLRTSSGPASPPNKRSLGDAATEPVVSTCLVLIPEAPPCLSAWQYVDVTVDGLRRFYEVLDANNDGTLWYAFEKFEKAAFMMMHFRILSAGPDYGHALDNI
jgi:hypothetical protein